MRMPDTSEILLLVQGVSLAFGGVKALRDVSFDIRKGEIRAIIGPNGAGKTSMLNVINGFYHPNHGAITFKGRTRARMQPFEASRGGIARTFQNVALFKGMSALDNMMAGRTLRMRRGLFWQMLRYGPALAEEIEHRHRVEEIIDFLEIEAIRKVPVARLPYGLQKRVELGRPCDGAGSSSPRRADGRHEPRGEGGHVAVHHRRQHSLRHNHCAD